MMETSAKTRRRIRRGAEPTILFGMPPNEPFGGDIHDGIFKTLEKRGLSWNVFVTDTRVRFRSSVWWMLRERRIDGAITGYHDDAETLALRRAGVPVVWIGPDTDEPIKWEKGGEGVFAVVTLDAPSVAKMAVEHFMSRSGFRSFGFVESYWDIGWSRSRGDAFMEAASATGLPVSRFLHYGRYALPKPEKGPDLSGLVAWLESLEKPAAVLCENDPMAVNLLDLCARRGIAVPRDVAVLGMDDNRFYWPHSKPSLSSVHFDGFTAGVRCVEALAPMLEGHQAPPTAALTYGATAIVQRASSGAVSTAGGMVQRALDFIEENFAGSIGVDDVARHLGVSRSLATLRFRQLLGRSICDAVREARVKAASRMLAESGTPEKRIAQVCGFGSVDSMRRAFRAITGCLPSASRGMRGG